MDLWLGKILKSAAATKFTSAVSQLIIKLCDLAKLMCLITCHMMNGGPISWSSRLQKLCAQSSAEADIYAVTDSVKEAVHIRFICEEAGNREIGTQIVVWEKQHRVYST